MKFLHFFGAKEIIKINKVIERQVSQIDIAPTIAKIMGFNADYAEGNILEEVFI